MMSWGKKTKTNKPTKIAPFNNVSVFDTFCERGPYSPPQLKSMGRGATFNNFRKNKYQQNQKLSEGLYSCEYNVNLIFKVFDEN